MLSKEPRIHHLTNKHYINHELYPQLCKQDSLVQKMIKYPKLNPVSSKNKTRLFSDYHRKKHKVPQTHLETEDLSPCEV